MRVRKVRRQRQAKPDYFFGSMVVTKLINRGMRQGKKTVAEKHIYKAFELIKEKTKQSPVEVLERALANIAPQMEVRSRRVGGAAYQVPMPVRQRRGSSLSIRWLIQEANKRPNKDYHTFADKLAAEIMAAANNEGGAITRKITAHKMADANKAFAHFRW